MTTGEALDSLPYTIHARILDFRREWIEAQKIVDEHKRYITKEIVRASSRGYIIGLSDAGAITETQRRVLTVYITV